MGMLRSIFFAVGFAAVGAVSVVGVQAAAHGGGGHGRGHGERLERLAAELDLDDAQKAQLDEVRALVEAHHEEGPARLLALIQGDTIDREAVHAEIDDKAALAHDVADGLLDLHADLRPEQRALLQEKLDHVRERHGH